MLKLLFNLMKKMLLSFLLILGVVTLINFATLTIFYSTNVNSVIHRINEERSYCLLCGEANNFDMLFAITSLGFVVCLMASLFSVLKNKENNIFVNFDNRTIDTNRKINTNSFFSDETIIQLRI